MLPILTLLTASALGLSAAVDTKPSAPDVGAVIPNFTLKDIHRRSPSA